MIERFLNIKNNVSSRTDYNEKFEENNELARLAVLTTIVNKGQSVGMLKILNKHKVSYSFVTKGYGTATNDIYDILGFGEEKKDIVFSIVKLSNWDKIRGDIEKRFDISKYAKGICLLTEVNSVAGVSTYKMLSKSLETNIKDKEDKIMETLNKNKFELIYSIVNDGYADIVMEAAKKAGATGGTIINGRGTGNKDIEKYFGIVITPEKQIVMILVPKEIKDDVLLSINEAMGINSKGQGITFSIPVNDTAGIYTKEDVE